MLDRPKRVLVEKRAVSLLVPETDLDKFPRDGCQGPFQYLAVEDGVLFILPGIDNADLSLTEVYHIVSGMISPEHDFHVVSRIVNRLDGQAIQNIQCFCTFGKIAVPQRSHTGG
ncbi:hypothetical protein SDC9_136616 [bioreactor metagenome]|uniref:Uncharacterized protein n=1 Tax=bioreactor metagenome TaxID=1076179 RepID=A0A645DJQ9_9ZZZZ